MAHCRWSSSVFLAVIPLVFFGMEHAVAQDRRANDTGPITLVACVVREADFVRSVTAATPASPTQLVLTDVRSGTPAYSLTGVRESELATHVGRRIEVTGTLERARTTPVLTTADGTRTGSVTAGAAGSAGVTPDGASAHEPTDALAATVRAGAVEDPALRATDPATLVATLPRLNATSFRTVEGTCAQPPPLKTASAAPESRNPPPVRASLPQTSREAVREERTITLRGCLTRQTQTGTALTPQSDSSDRLVLTNALSADLQPQDIRGAVPGSSPTGRGSGTVPDRVGVGSPRIAPAPVTYVLSSPSAMLEELTRHVGERMEIVGVTVGNPGDAAPSQETAHPSAPTREITVTSFRRLGGSCQ
jgi:hypothetical protein